MKLFNKQSIEIPDSINNIDDKICEESLICEVSKKSFKVIPQELKLYKQLNIPIPRKCPDIRHKERLALRAPRRLFDSKCDKCEKNIQTTYDINRIETVYCEECYLKEVY